MKILETIDTLLSKPKINSTRDLLFCLTLIFQIIPSLIFMPLFSEWFFILPIVLMLIGALFINAYFFLGTLIFIVVLLLGQPEFIILNPNGMSIAWLMSIFIAFFGLYRSSKWLNKRTRYILLWSLFCITFLFITLVVLINKYDQCLKYHSTNYQIQSITFQIIEQCQNAPGVPHDKFIRLKKNLLKLEKNQTLSLEAFLQALEVNEPRKKRLLDKLGRPLHVTIEEIDTQTERLLIIRYTIVSEPFRFLPFSTTERKFITYKNASSYSTGFLMISDASITNRK